MLHVACATVRIAGRPSATFQLEFPKWRIRPEFSASRQTRPLARYRTCTILLFFAEARSFSLSVRLGDVVASSSSAYPFSDFPTTSGAGQNSPAFSLNFSSQGWRKKLAWPHSQISPLPEHGCLRLRRNPTLGMRVYWAVSCPVTTSSTCVHVISRQKGSWDRLKDLLRGVEDFLVPTYPLTRHVGFEMHLRDDNLSQAPSVSGTEDDERRRLARHTLRLSPSTVRRRLRTRGLSSR